MKRKSRFRPMVQVVHWSDTHSMNSGMKHDGILGFTVYSRTHSMHTSEFQYDAQFFRNTRCQLLQYCSAVTPGLYSSDGYR